VTPAQCAAATRNSRLPRPSATLIATAKTHTEFILTPTATKEEHWRGPMASSSFAHADAPECQPNAAAVADGHAGGVPTVFHRADVSDVLRPGFGVAGPDRAAHGLRHAHRGRAGPVLTRLVVELLIPAWEPVLVAVDDTLLKRSGPTVHAASWFHDGSATGGHKIGFGNKWVVAAIVVRLPFLRRPVALPVGFALVRKDTDAASRLSLAAGWWPR